MVDFSQSMKQQYIFVSWSSCYLDIIVFNQIFFFFPKISLGYHIALVILSPLLCLGFDSFLKCMFSLLFQSFRYTVLLYNTIILYTVLLFMFSLLFQSFKYLYYSMDIHLEFIYLLKNILVASSFWWIKLW